MSKGLWIPLFALGFMGVAARGADAAKGQKLFAACAVCHDPGSANKVGPGLQGIASRKAGTFPGFRFSRAMRRSGITWGAASLDAYLADPQGTIPGNAMPFPGVADAKSRADLIAYLLSLR